MRLLVIQVVFLDLVSDRIDPSGSIVVDDIVDQSD